MMRWMCTLAVITWPVLNTFLLASAKAMESSGGSGGYSHDHSHSKSDEANLITCEAFEEERRAILKFDDNTTMRPSESKMPLPANLDIQGAEVELRANRKIVLQAVKRSGYALQSASPELKADRSIVLEAVKFSGPALQWASAELQADQMIVLVAVKRTGRALQWASTELKADSQVVLEAVKQDGSALEYACEELRSDRQMALQAVKQNGFALKWASAELQADRQVVLEAVKHYGAALEWASEELKGDQEIVLAAIQTNESVWWHRERGVLKWASAELKADRQVVLEAVKHSGADLMHASEELQSDRLIVLEAVKQDGWVIRYASKELRAERQIVLEAAKQGGGLFAFMFASEELKADRQLVLEAVKSDGRALCAVSEELQSDREIVLEAVKHRGSALYCASTELRADREIVLEAMEDDGYALHCASDELQRDRQLVLEAVKKDRRGLWIHRDFRDDREIILEAVKKDHSALYVASDRLKADRQIVLEACKGSPMALEHASKNLTEDQDFLIEAVKLQPMVVTLHKPGLEYLKSREARRLAISMANTTYECSVIARAWANFSLLQDREMVLGLAQNEVCYLPYPVLPEEYRCDPEIADLAMKKDGLFLEDACKALRANRSLVIAAVEQNADALCNASQVLQGDWELVALAAAQGKARQFCKDGVQIHGERAHALRALRIDGMLLQCASPEFKADKELVSVAVEQSGCALEFSSQQWRSDPDFVNQTLAHNGLALLYATEPLQCNSNMQHAALRSSGWDWLLSKILNNTADHAHSMALPKECITAGAVEEVTNNTATFVSGGLGLACLDALWPILSDGPLICHKPSSSLSSLAPVLLCVGIGCVLLVISAVMAIKRRAIMRGLTQTCSKDNHNQYYGVDLEGLINTRRPSANLEDVHHLGNTKPS